MLWKQEMEIPNEETAKIIEDTRNKKNIIGSFSSVSSLMEELNS
jgi:hypothetical protein